MRLHLLENVPDNPTIEFDEKGDDIVASSGDYPKYTPPNPATDADGRVYINKAQFFEGVPEAGWEFQVGGYQVLHKWLKDRRGRKLGYDDFEHYKRVVNALHETIRLMDEIDEAIPAWPIAIESLREAGAKWRSRQQPHAHLPEVRVASILKKAQIPHPPGSD